MIHHGDLFDVLPTLAAESVDACVTDGPYGISFMGKSWDNFSPTATAERIVENKQIESDNPNLRGRTRGPASSPSAVEYDRSLAGQRAFQEFSEQWGREVWRVLKPGAYILSCGAPRSHHRMMSGLEDAGFVVRDCFAWLFGSGFPKNLNLGDGKGTALKPAHEPIALAWKPFKGTITACHSQHGTAALNIDACRIGDDVSRGDRYNGKTPGGGESIFCANKQEDAWNTPSGRWPANVLLDEVAASALDEMTGERPSGGCEHDRSLVQNVTYGQYTPGQNIRRPADIGGASRFYYVAKPSREERDYGCEGLRVSSGGEATDRKEGTAGLNNPRAGAGRTGGARNIHPTVKPVELMRWLVKLVTPPGGIVLDPFTGSGTTGMACRYEHRQFIGIEREAEYVAIAERRIAAVAPLFSEASA
jgi:DNA modification methylase